MEKVIIKHFKNNFLELTVSKVLELQNISQKDTKIISNYLYERSELTVDELNNLDKKYNIKMDSIEAGDIGVQLNVEWSYDAFWNSDGFSILSEDLKYNPMNLLNFENKIPNNLTIATVMYSESGCSAEFFNEDDATFYFDYFLKVYNDNKFVVISKLQENKKRFEDKSSKDEWDFKKIDQINKLLELIN